MTPVAGAQGGGSPARHDPVMVDRVVALLAPPLDRTDAVAVDATVGLGGHAGAVLSRFPNARLVGMDRDPDALARAGAILDGYGDRVQLAQAVFDALPGVLAELGIERVDGVLFDLGVSSLQLDDSRRGFSYARDVALDMRMDPTSGPTAADVLNSYGADALARILREYGEERYARRIARAVVAERERLPFDTSARLAELVRANVPAPARRTGGHPAKRTFQALRIEVNGELAALGRGLPAAVDRLRVGGRVAVLAYHSLEDRLVKQTFARLARPSVPDGMPVVPPGHEPVLRPVTRGAEKPSEEEVAANPRAASARLRVAERIRDGRIGDGDLGAGGNRAGGNRAGRNSKGREAA